MRKYAKISTLVGSFLILVSLFFSGCGSNFDDLPAERALSADASFVFVFDYSNDGQVDKLENLFDKFPETTLVDKFKEKIFDDTPGNDGLINALSVFADLKPILSEDWKLLADVDLTETDLNVSDEGELVHTPDFVIVFQTEKPDKFEEFILSEDIFGKYLESLKEGEMVYWTGVVESSPVFILRYDSIFVFAPALEKLQESFARLQTGGGFDESLAYTEIIPSLAEENFGYFYVDMEKIGYFLGNFYGFAGMKHLMPFVDLFGAGYETFVAEDGGIRMIGEFYISDKDTAPAVEEVLLEHELALVDKVPGEGVIAYTEETLDYIHLEGFMSSYNNTYYALRGEEPPVFDVDEFLVNAAEFAGVTGDEIDSFFGLPLATVISDAGDYIPGVAAYLQLNDDNVEAGKKLMKAVDQYFGELVDGLDAAIVEGGGESGLLQRNVAIVKGAAFHKLSLSAARLPESYATWMRFVPALKDVVAEFYYGVSSDNVLIAALYPGFDEAYGKGVVLADNEDFEEALEQIGGYSGRHVEYLDIDPVFTFLDRYVENFAGGSLMYEVIVKYREVKEILSTIDYAISSSGIEDGIMRIEGYLGIRD